jgi:hypothetical protein
MMETISLIFLGIEAVTIVYIISGLFIMYLLGIFYGDK